METWKGELIEFLVACGALRFGSYTTKSGRQTPFFINFGAVDSGARLKLLAQAYARVITRDFAGRCTLLYGPAYKGIPLAVATSLALEAHHGLDVPFAFNRKEAKTHGEGGSLVGRAPVAGDRIVIVEDVTTAGTSVRESMEILGRIPGVKVEGLVIAVDRMERGAGELAALDEIRATYGLDTRALVTIEDILEHLHGRPVEGRVVLTDALADAIRAYRREWGARG